jgi:hypothetical protein
MAHHSSRQENTLSNDNDQTLADYITSYPKPTNALLNYDIIQCRDVQIHFTLERTVEVMDNVWVIFIDGTKHSEIKFVYLKEFKKTVIRYYCGDSPGSQWKHVKSNT